ncbi:MFS transporter [Halobaculum gomorrense]|uniref:Major Facilitator Superfamily protein n=1 Tax=Halobaculum gomorrense TaxID=43928 RepID=A0A1M5KMW7_9EURY|nr:MFS transporter [Halobaculum gomorrense]SHG54118.1 Major Facilitator Superfamily protein [Halobaculum gomorrense]
MTGASDAETTAAAGGGEFPGSTRRDRAALALVVYAVLLAQTLVYPGIDLLTAAFGGDGVAGPTLFLAVEFAAFALFAGPWGTLSDRLGERRRLVALAAGGGAVGYLALGSVAGVGLPFWAVLGLRALQGAMTVGALSLAISALADRAGGNGRNMGVAGIAIGLGTATGAPLGGQLFEVGATVPLYAAAGLLAVAAVGSLSVPDRPPGAGGGGAADGATETDATAGRRHGGLATLVAGLRDRRELAIPYAFAFADRLVAGFFALVGTLYFREAFGLGPGATGLMLAAFFAPFALLQYPFGLLSDRIGRVIPVAAGSAVFGLVVIAVGFAPSVPAVAATMVLVGVLGALMAPATLALVVDLAGDGERGAAVAGFNAAGSLGFLAGSLVGGAVAATFGYTAAFVVAGGSEFLLAVATLPALVRLGRRSGRTAVFSGGD